MSISALSAKRLLMQEHPEIKECFKTTLINYLFISNTLSNSNFKSIKSKFNNLIDRSKIFIEKDPAPHTFLDSQSELTAATKISVRRKRTLADPTHHKQLHQNLTHLAHGLNHETKVDLPLPLNELVLVEQLSKAFAYHTPTLYPTVDLFDSEGERYTFSVEKEPLCMGMYAYKLQSLDPDYKRSYLLFKGTSFHNAGEAAGATVVADLDPFGPGYLAYLWGRERITTWLQEQKTLGNQVVVTGHSLGGALAAHAHGLDSPLIYATVTFGSPPPGLPTYFSHLSLPQEKRERAINFDHIHDPVPYLGGFLPIKSYDVITDPTVGFHPKDEGNCLLECVAAPHRYTLFDKGAVILDKTENSPTYNWILEALKIVTLILPFIAAFTLLILWRLLFGYEDLPYLSLFGPLFYLADSCL